MKIVRKDFNNLGFTVIAEISDYHVDYYIYEQEGIMADGKVLFHKKDSDVSPDPVETIDESEVYASGFVKWDGCSNWYFDEQERVMLHGCDKDDLLNLGKILAECWEWTKVLCNNWIE